MMSLQERVRLFLESKFPFLLLLPLNLIFFIILLFPFALMIYLSFTDWNALMGPFWAAQLTFSNYVKLASDARLFNALKTTFILMAVCVPLEFLIGLSLAVLVSQPSIRGKRIFVTIFLAPLMMIPAVVAYTFYLLFFTSGPLNQLLSVVTLSSVRISWFTTIGLQLFPVIFSEIWQWTPFAFIVLYAGLVSLPQEPFRAARVLGASEWQIFTRLTLRYLSPFISLVVLIRALEVFKLFDYSFILYGGAVPGVETLSVYMYMTGFRFWNLAYIAAVAVVVLLAITIVIKFTLLDVLLGKK